MTDGFFDHSQEDTLADFLSGEMARTGKPAHEISPRALKAIRVHLGMDVAFISEFTNGRRVFRHVDSGVEDPPIAVGGSDALEDSYCERVIQGRLPQLIRDASKEPAALELPGTTTLPVGAHLSVPITLANGEIYGTFCCFSFTPDQSLTERDLAIMKVFAEFVAEEVEHEREDRRSLYEMYHRVKRVVAGDGLEMVAQPIVDLNLDRPAGYEALARFTQEPLRGPDVWFSEAAAVGLVEELDLRAVKAATDTLRVLPPDIFLSINVTPATALSGRLGTLLSDVGVARIVLEVTEHESVGSYEELAVALSPLRGQGLRVAVDDAGAGYASFRHILRLKPDFIKLDMSITRDIHTDPAKRALASALIAFARDTETLLIAEGIENAAELEVLKTLGVTLAQGYHLGRPAKLPGS